MIFVCQYGQIYDRQALHGRYARCLLATSCSSIALNSVCFSDLLASVHLPFTSVSPSTFFELPFQTVQRFLEDGELSWTQQASFC